MNFNIFNIKEYNFLQNPWVRFIIVFLLIGLIAFITIFLTIFYVDKVYLHSFCFSHYCYKKFSELFKPAIEFFSFLLNFVYQVGTTLGIVIAAWTYKQNKIHQSFSNHISNYEMFQKFLEHEIQKGLRLSPKTINTFKIYNFIYDQSRKGNFSVSKKYESKIEELHEIINKKNEPDTSNFDYKDHQNKMKKFFKELGIELDFLPRNDFLEMEGDLFNLIDNINIEFCFMPKEKFKLPSRIYSNF